jgi:hypothetical protein
MNSLPLFDQRTRAPKFTARDVDILIRALQQPEVWSTAKQLRERFNFRDRELRALAHDSKGRIVTGQKGYALIEAVTVREAQHAADWLKHQAREMLTRAAEIERALHQRQTQAA